MSPFARIKRFGQDDSGGILLLGAMSMVLLIGMVGVIYDIGRLSATHSELQDFADSVSLTAASELDGQPDAITRAQSAANTLTAGHQTFASGAQTLVASDVIELTFYRPNSEGKFSREAALETTDPRVARYVQAQVSDHTILAGLSRVLGRTEDTNVGARAVAGFALEVCDIAPVAVCLPSVSFDARTQIGSTLELDTSVNLGSLLPGNLAVVDTLTSALDGLGVCAGILGNQLSACLLAAREPKTACIGQGGLKLDLNINGSDLLSSLNTRFDEFGGIASGLVGNPAFSAAPNILSGLTSGGGVCDALDLSNLTGTDADIRLPLDDCLVFGGCNVQGNGDWTAGRQAYIDAHYDGTDPHPNANTRFKFYQAEVAASGTIPAPASLLESVGGLVGGVVGGLLGGSSRPTPKLCAPQENLDTTRRLMVVAGIDCSGGGPGVTASAPPVQEFFEVFALGPGENGKLAVEITACLGKGCGNGNLDTDVIDVVRLVE